MLLKVCFKVYITMKAEISVPESLEEITLGQYQAFLKIEETLKGTKADEFLGQKMIEIFCNIPLREVLLIKLSSAREIVAHITNLFQNRNDKNLINRFKIKEVEFGFIPNLEKISLGEYVDLDENITDWQKMHKAMAVLYRPIKHTYKETYELTEYKGTDEFAELMKFMPLSVVFSAHIFFYNLEKELLKAIPNYLEKEMMELITAKTPNSIKSGDGTIPYTHLLKEILQDSTLSQENQYTNA